MRGSGKRATPLPQPGAGHQPPIRAHNMRLAAQLCLTSCKIMAETAKTRRGERSGGWFVKILVAEDDLQSSEFLRKGLVQEGHSVECVGDGRDALSYCLYNTCDMLILDRMMPGLDGLSVLKGLRAAGRKTPVLFLT